MTDTPQRQKTIRATGRRYSGVDEFMRGEDFSKEVSDRTKEIFQETRVTRALTLLRCRAGLTQAEIGKRIGKSQSAVSKLEAGRDEDLTLAEINSYAQVLNERVGLVFGPKMNHVEAIKTYALAMRERMKALAALAHSDDEIEKEIQAFFGEAFFNLLTILGSSLAELPDNGSEVLVHLLGSTGIRATTVPEGGLSGPPARLEKALA